ncbi:hypothetical protein ACFC5X_19965 [Streptomyces sp. NPDC055952]|uniref:hypothetical protein n=1 Tax=Streptomyces sp. NPDC055952 TaxID=3345663 RepID=UPI0035D63699
MRALLAARLRALNSRRAPCYPREEAADLGDEEAAAQLIEHGTQMRAARKLLPSAFNERGLLVSKDRVSVTPVIWSDSQGETARAVFAAHMGLLARRLGDTDDLDAFAAQFRSSVIAHGHLLKHEEAAALRGHLAPRSQALRTALATGATSSP